MLTWQAILVVSIAQQPAVWINVTPQTINAGDSAALVWRSSPGGRVFVSTLATTEPSGRRVVRPVATTTYTIVSEEPDGLSSYSTTLVVTGAKDGGARPSADEYRYGFNYRTSTPSLIPFLQQVQHELQDDLHYSVDMVRDVAGNYVFTTTLAMTAQALLDDAGISHWRVSYLLEVQPPAHGAKVLFKVKTAIQYQRRAESVWRTETDPTIHEGQAHRLAILLGAEGVR